MKIVFLAPFGIRPKGTVIARMVPLAVALQERGHQVVIVAPPYTNPEDSGKTEMVRGVKLVNIRLAGGGKALAAPVLAWRMFAAAREERPDLLHLFKPKGYGGLAAALHFFLRRPEPLFVDTDDREGRGGMNELHAYSGAERVLYDFQERTIPRRAAGVTAASRELAMLTGRSGVAEEKILYLPNCVEESPPGKRALFRERLAIAPEAPVLLLYTRFFEFSQPRLYRVLEGVVRRVPEVRILVAGKGRRGEDEQLLRAATEGGFRNRLAVAGWVRPEEIPDLLAAADAAIYPLDDTAVNRAKCPAKLTEILRAGVPVVADRVGQVVEYLGGTPSLLCDPEDPETMVAAAVGLLTGSATRTQMGTRGKEYLLDNFGWSRYALELEEFYRKRVNG